ncbi:MAG TPA: DNA/RNA helicase domain-containing protein, partial [Bryobacteraceae bacterium]
MAIKAYYNSSIADFLREDEERILGVLATEHHFALEEAQRDAWLSQILLLKTTLQNRANGRIFFEFFIPRMGKRADALLIWRNVIFLLEFKVGAVHHLAAALAQVEDYALDLKNFHEGSHRVAIVPVLVSTHATDKPICDVRFADDLLSTPVVTNAAGLSEVIDLVTAARSFPTIDVDEWMTKGYKPTPTIVEAAQVLYRTHSVNDISRSDAGARNLRQTSAAVSAIIDRARQTQKKAICFVTGVPGSGKTLAGLNIASTRSEEHREEHAVFLSGNGPLVDVLREALARDKAQRESVSKKTAEREVRSFIQNIHHFRDHYLKNHEIPVEKVTIFDEAQRAWTREQTSRFMRRKRGLANFDMSEPEFLIRVMDRHAGWCTVVCLV